MSSTMATKGSVSPDQHSIPESSTAGLFGPSDQPSPEREKKNDAPPDLEAIPSVQQGSEAGFHGKHDPFANEKAGGMQYKTLAWWQAGMVMIAETISLGILSLPSTLAVLGMIPGVICILGLGIMATYSGYVIGQFKLRYPHVHNMGDAGEVLAGRIGREVLAFAQLLFFVFIMGAHILTFGIMMNAITNHGTCTVVFTIVGMILSLLLTLPRTLRNVSYFSIVSFASIIGAVMITMIGVSITKPSQGNINLWPQGPLFYEAFLAVANIVFAYAGHVAFFSFISELKDPKEFPKALCLLQVSDISMYLVVAIVVYFYAGSSVASPALDSTGHVVRKVAYGIACPTIVIAGVVNGHVAVKYLYVRWFRNSEQDIMHQTTWKAYGYWAAINAVLWTAAWLIAEVVPVFNDLLGVTSALFASWFTFGLSPMFWWHLNKGQYTKNWKKVSLFLANVLNVIIALCICVIGLYASSMSIKAHSSVGKPFSCADSSLG